jgi:hypothetical protein
MKKFLLVFLLLFSCSKEPAKLNVDNNENYSDTIIVELPINDNIDDITCDMESIVNESEEASEEILDNSDNEEISSIEEASDEISDDF